MSLQNTIDELLHQLRVFLSFRRHTNQPPSQLRSLPATPPLPQSRASPAPAPATDTRETEEHSKPEPVDTRKALNEILGDFSIESWILSDDVKRPKGAAEIIENVQHVAKLPTLASVANQFRRMSFAADQNADAIAELINADPTLTSQILRVSNSAYYGVFDNQIDIQQSILRLGTDRIQMLASLLSGQSFIEKWDMKFKWRLLWMHSLATALLSANVAEFFRLPHSPNLYTGALLHDIGKIVLSYLYPDLYRDILINAHQSNHNLREAEREMLEIDHEEVGGIFAKLNHFPDNVHAIVRYHSNPAECEEHHVEIAIVEVANMVAQANNLGYSGDLTGIQTPWEAMPAWQLLKTASGMQNNKSLEDAFEIFIGSEISSIQQQLRASFITPEEGARQEKKRLREQGFSHGVLGLRMA